MACCVVGSLLMLLASAIVRGLRRRLLRHAPDAPEVWRLGGAETTSIAE